MSYSSDRSGSSNLHGATIDEDDTIYVWVVNHASIDRVSFTIYDTAAPGTALYSNTEEVTPWDLGGSVSVAVAGGVVPLTSGFGDGPASYTLRVDVIPYAGGTTVTLYATFTVVD